MPPAGTKAAAPSLPEATKKPPRPQPSRRRWNPRSERPIPEPKEKERPISTTKAKSVTPAKKEAPPPETDPTDDEVRRLDERIREMRTIASMRTWWQEE